MSAELDTFPKPRVLISVWHAVVIVVKTELSVAFEQLGWLQNPIKYESKGPDSDVLAPPVRTGSKPGGFKHAACGFSKRLPRPD